MLRQVLLETIAYCEEARAKMPACQREPMDELLRQLCIALGQAIRIDADSGPG
jgi:hypothetical protein